MSKRSIGVEFIVSSGTIYGYIYQELNHRTSYNI